MSIICKAAISNVNTSLVLSATVQPMQANYKDIETMVR